MTLYLIYVPPYKIDALTVGGPMKVKVELEKSINIAVADLAIAQQLCQVAGDDSYPMKYEDAFEVGNDFHSVFLIRDAQSYDRYWKFVTSRPTDSNWVSSFVVNLRFDGSEWKEIVQ